MGLTREIGMEYGSTRVPAAVSASLRSSGREGESPRFDRDAWRADVLGRPGGTAAVSAQRSHPRSSVGDPRRAAATLSSPVVGPYTGWTAERHPQPVSLRFVGSGIRDLTIGERQAAQWVPVRDGKGSGSARGAEVIVSWTDARELEGRLVRGRGRRAKTVRFVAEHRFRRFA
jgi:hypothetical protein